MLYDIIGSWRIAHHNSEKIEESKMGEPENDPALDLEDGEIESDGEEAAPPVEKPAEEVKKEVDVTQKKKKKSKSHKKEEKTQSTKPKKKHPSPVEDDFAGKVEKAIRKQMKHDEGVEEDMIVHEIVDDEEIESAEPEERRKSKKRKKHDSSGAKKKRRRKHDSEELNDDEFMFTRGASPPPLRRSPSPYDYRSDNSYDSGGSYDDHRQPQDRPPNPRNRPPQHIRDRKNAKNPRRRDNIHPMQDPEGVCLYFMQGKCHKGDDCSFSHDAQPPRKMELCKFYLMDCCAKRDKCLYLHADFPCKYYHTGLQCKNDCKFSHGGPLTDNLRSILLKHIESAPKEILGDFPRLSRDNAIMMINATQMKLSQQYGAPEGNDSSIPSFYEMNSSKPHDDGHMYNQYDKHGNRNAHKNRQSRWQTSTVDIPSNFNNVANNMNNMPNNFNSTNIMSNIPNVLGNPMINEDVLSIRNLTGVLTPQQISDLLKLGIENLNQLSQLTVIQLNQLGLNLKQINEIQLNTLSIQKLGLIDGGDTSIPKFSTPVTATKDLDMRVAPAIPDVANNSVSPTDNLGQDVDMRFQSPSTTSSNISSARSMNSVTESKLSDPRVSNPRKHQQQQNKDTIDIDQYTKDALKFASKEREHVDDMSDDFHDNGELSIDEQIAVDTDHRTQHSEKEHTVANSNNDTDSRFLHPDSFTKKPEKRHRRSTTDDEDNNLLIDEKWYSSDEEKSCKTKSPHYSPRGPSTPPKYSPQRSPRRPTTPPEPASFLGRLGDLSKIQVSDEVTKLLATMKNNLKGSQSPKTEVSKPRDPRSQPKKSPEHKSTNPPDLMKVIAPKKPKISIYECVEGATSDRRRRSDVDLRQLDPDFRLPPLGDTDLRADVDFRLGMPFKPLPNHTPATEIDGSINSHPPIPYKLKTVDIPRPDYSDIKDGTAKSQAMADPRLRKLFRLSIDEASSDGEKSSKPIAAPRSDPRKKPSPAEPEQKPASVDIQNVTNNSSWYKELSTNQKIFVNQQLATVNSMLRKYQQLEKPLGRRFDVSQVQGNPIIFSIFNNLGVSVDEAGEIAYSKSQESLIKSPLYMGPEYGQMMDSVSMIGAPPPMGMPSMPMGPMNPMAGFNAPFPNPANLPAPGLLGYAPNMPAPPGFGLSTYGGHGSDGFHGNMPMNSVGDYGNMDDDSYNSNQNRGSYRGRGGERWSRGGPQRGTNRDRRHYDKGGGWKGDRH